MTDTKMLKQGLLERNHTYDFVVIGGGISGMAAAVAAARHGLKVALVQDRSVLGGNTSKEIRMVLVGASRCNFAYSRETGLMEELLLENMRSNPTCSIEGWDLVMRNFIKAESTLDLFLDTPVLTVTMDPDRRRIASVRGFELGAETWHVFNAAFFADCTGDGTVAALAGNPFRMGCEARSEFDESLAPAVAEQRTMGDSIMFRGHDAGRPVPFTPPAWVTYRFTEEDFGGNRPIIKEFRRDKGGFWWLEWGGAHDTIHDTRMITDRILMIVYGVWDFLKNRSSICGELITWELDWVGPVVGKRESRRLMGDYILTQKDIAEQRQFADAVAYGGWSIDDHPPGGFFEKEFSATNAWLPGPYNIPLRSLYSSAMDNLFFAGRNLSATHLALCSTRVMLTCGQLGEAVGTAAACCHNGAITPRQLAAYDRVRQLQILLQQNDHHIARLPYADSENIAPLARVRASSELSTTGLEDSIGATSLAENRLWQFTVVSSQLDALEILIDAERPTTLTYAVYAGPANGSTFPEKKLCTGECAVAAGARQWIRIPADVVISQPGWHFLEVQANPAIKVHYGKHRPVGFKSYVCPQKEPDLNLNSRWPVYSRWQVWGDQNHWFRDWGGMDLPAYCLRLFPAQRAYRAENIVNPWLRPDALPHLWISATTDFKKPEWVELQWDQPQRAHTIDLLFDSTLDFDIFNLWDNYEKTSLPSMVCEYRLLGRAAAGSKWRELASAKDNYLRHRVHKCENLALQALRLEILATHGAPRAQVYAVRVFGEKT